MAPTVELCRQQHKALSQALPHVQTRLLTGADNVDRWKSKSIWDTVLDRVRIVVSTPAILYNALGSGFVRMGQLALLVFDEGGSSLFETLYTRLIQLIAAHNCVRRNPGNMIMKEHYHPYLNEFGEDAAPSILGLTASPTSRSKVTDIA